VSDRDVPSIDALLAIALAEPADSDGRWAAVHAVQARGDQATFDAAVALCGSDEAHRRRLGVDVLGGIGKRGPDYETHGVAMGVYADERPFRRPAVDRLLEMVQGEGDPDVLIGIALAFGHLEDVRAIAPLARLSGHHNEDVRCAVAVGLQRHDEDLAVDTLVELSRDSASDVRDWATFGLGTQLDRDTPQIRDALVARLGDEHQTTREGAIVGAAIRGDSRAIEPLLELLDSGREDTLLDEALATIAARVDDPRLEPYVLARRQRR
jgi:HEAT repeat protein